MTGPGPATPSAFNVLSSTIGLKLLMAVTGVGLVLFALQHMVGHLQMFGGRDVYNAYAANMQALGMIKWGARFGLLALLVIHIRCAMVLTARNRAARPQAYAAYRTRRTTAYGKTMLLTGVTFVAFLVYHLLHFTLGVVHPEYFSAVDSAGRPDVYGNFVHSFQHPLITGVYLVAVVGVSMHFAHATSSMLRTLGISAGKWKPTCEKIGPALGLVLLVGFAIVPLACLLGLLQP